MLPEFVARIILAPRMRLAKITSRGLVLIWAFAAWNTGEKQYSVVQVSTAHGSSRSNWTAKAPPRGVEDCLKHNFIHDCP
jgi:hypothetical protein